MRGAMAWVLGAVGLLWACGVDNPGVDPPAGRLNFPVSVTLSPDGPPSFLFVASSNFDLRYNAGSVQSYALDEVQRAVDGCAAPPCSFDDLDQFVVSEVLVGSHAAGMDISPDGDRLYLAVRSETNLTFIDVDETGTLSCGGSGNPPRCGDRFRRGDEAIANERGVSLPADPVGVVAGSLALLGRDPADGDYVLMAHRGTTSQNTGRVSLFLDQAEGANDGPTLVHVVSGLPEGLVNVQLDPRGFAWVPSGSIARIGRVGVAIDAETNDLVRSFAYDLGTLAILGVDNGGRGDTRDVAFDPRPEVDRVYVLSRRPEAILIADRELAEAGDLGVVDAVPIGYGPSRLEIAQIDVTPEGGEPRTRTLLFASCFDSRDVWVVDPDLGEVVSVIRGMSGPFELAVDPARDLVYVADFRSSVIRVVDLAPMLECLREGGMPDGSCDAEVAVVLGEPRPVGELL